MIYLDTSVVLAQLLAEDHRPPPELWQESLVASRLVEYEVWNRINTAGLAGSHGDPTRVLLARIAFLELTPAVFARALEPFPVPVRTLDALHLASAMFLVERGVELSVATYDKKMQEAAVAMALAAYAV